MKRRTRNDDPQALLDVIEDLRWEVRVLRDAVVELHQEVQWRNRNAEPLTEAVPVTTQHFRDDRLPAIVGLPPATRQQTLFG